MADQNIENACHKLADDTQIYALKAFNIKLDYTNKSIKKLEFILSKMHKLALHDKPNEDQIMEFSKGFDSHLGKVYIRNYGDQWVMAGINEKSYPGIHCDNNEFYFWPWMKVFHRISIGSENNIWWYYEVLIKNNLKTSNFYQDHLKIWWNKFSSFFKAQAFI